MIILLQEPSSYKIYIDLLNHQLPPAPAILPVYNLEHSSIFFSNSNTSDSKHSETDFRQKIFHNRNYSLNEKRQKQNFNHYKFQRPFNKKYIHSSFRQRTVNQCAFLGRYDHLMKICCEFENFVQSMNQSHSYNSVNMLQRPYNDYQITQQNIHEKNEICPNENRLN